MRQIRVIEFRVKCELFDTLNAEVTLCYISICDADPASGSSPDEDEQPPHTRDSADEQPNTAPQVSQYILSVSQCMDSGDGADALIKS